MDGESHTPNTRAEVAEKEIIVMPITFGEGVRGHGMKSRNTILTFHYGRRRPSTTLARLPAQQAARPRGRATRTPGRASQLAHRRRERQHHEPPSHTADKNGGAR